jgi:hypothetical protein
MLGRERRYLRCICHRVRAGPTILAVVLGLLFSSCGGAAALPTSPTSSTQIPTGPLASPPDGAWRGSVRSAAVRAGSGISVGFGLNCSQTWEISFQPDGHFDGTMRSQGTGPDSDWRCTSERRITGELTSDDHVTVEFIPDFRPGGCTNVVGGARATGSMTANTITLAIPYRATCEMSSGGDAPSWDLEIAATLTLTPR